MPSSIPTPATTTMVTTAMANSGRLYLATAARSRHLTSFDADRDEDGAQRRIRQARDEPGRHEEDDRDEQARDEVDGLRPTA